MKKGFTELVFILDRSGSMHGLEGDTIGGFNSMIEKQRTQEGEAAVTTVLFDDRYELVHDREELGAVRALTDKEYFVRGSTALLDAMGSTISRIANRQKQEPESDQAEKTIFIIITDGMENASMEYSHDTVRKLVEQQKEVGWEFMFLGANMDAIEEAGRFGISADRAVRYHCDSTGIGVTYDAVGEVVCEMRVACKTADLGAEWKADIEEDFRRRGL